MDANIIPKVTVIVATHNRPDYLFRCLLAIKLQTFKEFECIVVGDNCNYSENVFKEFADDKRFVYFKTAIIEENLGAISKNLGINKSKTDYICYCDDDNILLSNHVEILYNNIILSKKELVFSKLKEISFNELSTFEILNRDLYYGIQNIDKEFISNITHRDALVIIHTKESAIKIGLWKSVNFAERSEDGDFIVRLKEHVKHEIIYLDEITAIYYNHRPNNVRKESDSYLQSLNSLKNEIYVYPELIQKLKQKYFT